MEKDKFVGICKIGEKGQIVIPSRSISNILTTHYMEEAKSLLDRVGSMAHGNLIDIGTAEELIKKSNSSNFEEAFVKIATGGEL